MAANITIYADTTVIMIMTITGTKTMIMTMAVTKTMILTV